MDISSIKGFKYLSKRESQTLIDKTRAVPGEVSFPLTPQLKRKCHYSSMEFIIFLPRVPQRAAKKIEWQTPTVLIAQNPI